MAKKTIDAYALPGFDFYSDNTAVSWHYTKEGDLEIQQDDAFILIPANGVETFKRAILMNS